MASKYWKYEADCKRIDALIDQTVVDGKLPGWGHCAKKVVFTLRIVRPRATPLALHFVSVSAKEMLEGRHDVAKMCLTVAQAISDKALMNEILDLFGKAFATPCTCAACQKRVEALKKLDATVGALESKLKEQMGPGMNMPPGMVQMIGNALQGISGKLVDLPEGVSEVEILRGLKAHVIKQKLSGPAPQGKMSKAKKAGMKTAEKGGNPRWN